MQIDDVYQNADGTQSPAIGLYSNADDSPVILRNIAPGVEDRDAANVGQLCTKLPQPVDGVQVGDYLRVAAVSEDGKMVTKLVRADPPTDGEDGKTAYQYAQDGGYTGTEAQFAARLALPFLTPEMYGAKGDGVTDDSTAIQAAIDAAGTTPVYLSRKTYAISTGLSFSHSNRRFKCDGTLSYSGENAAVTIGSHTIVAEIDTIAAPNGTAVKVAGANKYIANCQITVGRINSSKIGLHLYTDTVSVTYNQFRIGHISATEIGVYAECQASYINENWYWLGKITGCTTGVKLYSADALESAAGFGANDNHFFSGSFEGIADDGCAIHIENSSGNKFEHLRCAENYGKNSIVLRGFSKGNDIKLSRINLSEIDISEHTGGHSNILRSTMISDESNGYILGTEARIDAESNLGITYDARCARIGISVYEGVFTDNVISQINKLIPNALYFELESINGKTYTLGNIYSHYLSMAQGTPVAVIFGETGGRVLLVDTNGDTILDNTDGKYAGKTLSIQWVGYDKTGGNNVWSIIKNAALTTEIWEFTIADGSTVQKAVLLG
jgi:hypothetical protein